MITKIWLWLITTRLGQALLLALAISVTAFLVHWYVDAKAYNRGLGDCAAEHAKAVSDANIAQSKREQEQRESATEIEKETDAVVDTAVAEIDTTTAETREVIRYVYRDPPTPTAVACVPQPLDPRVQERIDRAVDSANRTGSTLQEGSRTPSVESTPSQRMAGPVRAAE